MTTALGTSRRGAVAVLLAGLVAVAVASTNLFAAAAPGARVPVIVRALPGAGAEARDAIEQAGGSVSRELALIGGFAARVPEHALRRLASAAGVRSVVPDPKVRLLQVVDGFDGAADSGSMYNTAGTMGVRSAWTAGFTGKGVDVAILDSGVAPVQGLTLAGKVVNGADLSFDSQSDSTRYVDGYGHGTHLAGIIAGRDAAAPTNKKIDRDSVDFIGVAPDARLVNVKVADATGATDVSQVIAGIDWVVQHRHDNGLNIRVLNLSFGTDASQGHEDDPLAYAAEMAWRKGIVVVVAAGNEGSGLGHLMNPAADPYVLAVGADDSKGTPDVADDAIPDFSNWGDGTRNPDLLAPGRSLISLRDPGSWIDQNHPEGRVNSRLFRGSGTSQAAAAVSGAVADLIQQRPSISPDQVKALLRTTASALPGVDPRVQGAGLVNVAAALWAATPTTVQEWALSGGGGSLEQARGSLHLVHDGVALSGEQDIFGQAFDASALAAAAAEETSWDGGIWNGSSWSGSSWSGSSWSGSSWSGSTWSGSSWSGSSWSGSSWSGGIWSGAPPTTTTCSGKKCSNERSSNSKWGA